MLFSRLAVKFDIEERCCSRSGHLSVIEVPTETLKAEVLYKVDVTRRVLVQSAKGERGSGSLSGKSSSVKS